jgi:hypothetical protein
MMGDVYSDMASKAQTANAPMKAAYDAASIVESKIAELQEDVKRLESIKSEIETLRKEFKDAQMSKRYYYGALAVALLSLVVGTIALFK